MDAHLVCDVDRGGGGSGSGGDFGALAWPGGVLGRERAAREQAAFDVAFAGLLAFCVLDHVPGGGGGESVCV